MSHNEISSKLLARQLAQEFGKGFDISNLRNMRRFYQAYPIQDALRPELSWTHYKYIAVDENADVGRNVPILATEIESCAQLILSLEKELRYGV